jgi:hypothetical protein
MMLYVTVIAMFTSSTKEIGAQKLLGDYWFYYPVSNNNVLTNSLKIKYYQSLRIRNEGFAGELQDRNCCRARIESADSIVYEDGLHCLNSMAKYFVLDDIGNVDVLDILKDTNI